MTVELGMVIGAIAAIIVGAAVAAWALFADRSRGRRRCARCWYDMAGAPSLRRPECGAAARSKRRLGATRRRWRIALIGGVLLAGGAVGLAAPWRARPPWVQAAPTGMLIVLTPARWETGDGAIARELRIRMRSGALTPEQLQGLFDRRLRRHPEDFARFVRIRPKWPVGVPLRVSADVREYRLTAPIWAKSVLNRQIVVAGELPGAATFARWIGADGGAAFGSGLQSVPYDPTVEFGLPDRDADHIPVRLKLRVPHQLSPNTSSWIAKEETAIWSGAVRVPIELVDDVGEILAPHRSEEFERALREARVKIEARYASVMVEIHFHGLPQLLPGVALDSRIEILCDGVVLAQTEMIRAGHSSRLGRSEIWDMHRSFREILAATPPSAAAGQRWEVRITGDPIIALRDLEATEYWAGEVTIPVDVTDRRGFTR